MSEPQIQYTKTSDGVGIAYFAIGSGPTLLYVPPMPWTHVELEWKGRFAPKLRGRCAPRDVRALRRTRLGLSDRSASDFSLDAMVRDLEAVAAALGAEPFMLVAAQHMAMPALAYAAKHPERVSGLVLWLGIARGEEILARRGTTMVELALSDWDYFKEITAHTIGFDRPHAHQAFQKLMDEATTQESYVAFVEAMRRWDGRDLLRQVRVPVLLLGRREYRLIPIETVRQLAAALRNAELVTLEGSATAFATPDAAAAIGAFLSRVMSSRPAEPAREAAASSGTRTILFTDIVGHTEMMQRLGDAKGRDVLREHERITRETLKAHGGAEVKTMGDGFMASFGSVTQAMQCAIALQRAFAAHTEKEGEPLHVRVGLNAGEPIEEDGDLFGATVILASRIAAKAEGGEILIPEPVRHLLSGKAFTFSDRGEYAMKGFDDAVRLYEVRWQQ